MMLIMLLNPSIRVSAHRTDETAVISNTPLAWWVGQYARAGEVTHSPRTRNARECAQNLQ